MIPKTIRGKSQMKIRRKIRSKSRRLGPDRFAYVYVERHLCTMYLRLL